VFGATHRSQFLTGRPERNFRVWVIYVLGSSYKGLPVLAHGVPSPLNRACYQVQSVAANDFVALIASDLIRGPSYSPTGCGNRIPAAPEGVRAGLAESIAERRGRQHTSEPASADN
jgi:hypothetical protein